MARPTSSAPATDAQGYQHGSMPVREQAETYALFMRLAKWGSLHTATILLFLVLWFRPGGSFFGALIAAVVLAVAGYFFLKSKPAKH